MYLRVGYLIGLAGQLSLCEVQVHTYTTGSAAVTHHASLCGHPAPDAVAECVRCVLSLFACQNGIAPATQHGIIHGMAA
jgi:hypothetical protein